MLPLLLGCVYGDHDLFEWVRQYGVRSKEFRLEEVTSQDSGPLLIQGCPCQYVLLTGVYEFLGHALGE